MFITQFEYRDFILLINTFISNNGVVIYIRITNINLILLLETNNCIFSIFCY